MRQDLAVFKQKPLALWIPETKGEIERGYASKPVRDGEGMLFLPGTIDENLAECFIPIKIAERAEPLDVVWLWRDRVNAFVTHYGGIVLGYGNSVLELPPGWCLTNKVRLGDLLARENGTQEKTA